MKIIHAPLQGLRAGAARVGLLLGLLLVLVVGASAQSTDIEFPTPVRSNEISGTIVARDVGDPRLTRYFYSLTGTNGDLAITVESQNLNGDVDLFTAGSLRPLVKLTMYAGGAPTTTSRSLYFKREEPLILRVEARTPNDTPGTFRIRFEGAFAPIVGEVREPEPVGPTTPEPNITTGRKTKRVTATGARIEEPVEETTARTAPSEIPATPTETGTNERTTETTPPTTATTAEPERPRTPRSSARTRRPRTPRTQTPTARNRRPSQQPPAETLPPTQPEQPVATQPPGTLAETATAGPRLIIETKDGLRVERYMTSVRRVTVDNGQIVVILRNGQIERRPLANVLKMSIEP